MTPDKALLSTEKNRYLFILFSTKNTAMEEVKSNALSG